MKSKIILRITFLLASAFLLVMCTKSDIEKAREAYDASQVIPSVLGITGSTLVLQTFSYPYTVTYDRAGSTWTWTANGATIQSVSDDTKTATVLFSTIPANDTALVKVTETTFGGTTSPEKVYRVKVNPFCPLVNGITDLAGSWSGDDAGYTSEIITTKVGSDLKAQGMGVGFIADFWGEDIVTLGTFKITINDNGTLDIPRQYVFTTVYSGDNYDYEIKGAGTWANCGASPTFLIKYDIYYPGDADGLAKQYASYLDNIPYLTAAITLD